MRVCVARRTDPRQNPPALMKKPLSCRPVPLPCSCGGFGSGAKGTAARVIQAEVIPGCRAARSVFCFAASCLSNKAAVIRNLLALGVRNRRNTVAHSQHLLILESDWYTPQNFPRTCDAPLRLEAVPAFVGRQKSVLVPGQPRGAYCRGWHVS